MSSARKLPAKAMKRVGQLRRLGARGLVRTAYVRTLGPTVYSLTDRTRSVAAVLHRQKALTHALPSRLERLKERTSTLPRTMPRNATKITFGAEVGTFVQTVEAFLDLSEANCRVAKIVHVDWETHVIAVERVDGTRPKGTEGELSKLEEALTSIHLAGYVLGKIGEDSIVFDSDGEALVSDLRHAVPLAGLSRDMSVHLRDEDRRLFNRMFGTHLLTARELRKLLSPSATIPRDEVESLYHQVYAPVVLRDDIRWGKIWNTDLGTGRWNFIMKDHLPIPAGGTVLDLGSNNGFNPLQMLRSGARSAVGIEIHEPAIKQAMFLKSAFEWLDNRSYDFRCIHGSQGDLPKFDLPRFDIVTALCSLYYLPADQFRDLVRYIATRTNLLVLQCNVDRLIDRGGNQENYRKASVEFAVETLEQAGFRNREIIAPPGYSRPLVIGRLETVRTSI